MNKEKICPIINNPCLKNKCLFYSTASEYQAVRTAHITYVYNEYNERNNNNVLDNRDERAKYEVCKHAGAIIGIFDLPKNEREYGHCARCNYELEKTIKVDINPRMDKRLLFICDLCKTKHFIDENGIELVYKEEGKI